MGIEGDQLVFDYLSRVGDLAHGVSMSAGERAALVVRLREEIGRKRAEAGGADGRGDVQRILKKMGRPEDVVAAAAEAGQGAPPSVAVPAPRPTTDAAPPAGPEVPVGAARTPPQRPPAPDTYWPDGEIGGFTGGIEIPEMLRPPAERRADLVDVPAGPDEGTAVEQVPGQQPDPSQGTAKNAPKPSKNGAKNGAKEAAKAAAKGKFGVARGRRRLRAAAAQARGRVGGPVELLGALVLFAAAVLAELPAFVLGWALAYWSPRLSRREAQWATFGMPGLVAGGYVVWLLGSTNANVALGGALADHWPWLLRGGALASAVFLLYRARRPKPEPELT